MKKLLIAAIVLIGISAASYGQATAKAKDMHAADKHKTVKTEAAKPNSQTAVTPASSEKKDAAIGKKHKAHKKASKVKTQK